MSSSMVSLRGRLQKEGEVIHVIVDHIADLTPMLRQVGSIDFPHRPGHGDGATHAGSPDRGDVGWLPRASAHYHSPFAGGADPEDLIKVRSHDFH